MRSQNRYLIATLVLLWVISASAIELYRSWWLWDADPWTTEQPSTWRITSARVDDLRQLLQPLETTTSGRLWVVPRQDLEGEGIFFVLWTRYLLPRFEVHAARPAAGDAGFLLTGSGVRLAPLNETPVEEVSSTTAGTLYRIHASALPGAE